MTPKLTKRNSYLEWEEYFMAIAFLSAQRSKDPRTQVGACIVNQDKKIVGIGYNGMPIGCDDDTMPWNKANDENEESWLQSKTPYVCHAELNAVLNKNLADIKGCIIYVALFPCNMCSQIIIQSGIKEVVYYSDKYHDQAKFKASRFLLDTAKVKYRQFRPRQKNIVIDFDCIEETENQVINTSDHKIQCLNPQEMKKTNEDSVLFGSEILRNGQAGENLEVNINCNSKNKYLSCKKECVGMPINNNNKGTPKVYKLEDQMGQQHLQLHQDDEPTALQMAPSPASPDVRDELLEFKFAAVSTVVIVFVAFFSWYLSHCKLVISNSA